MVTAERYPCGMSTYQIRSESDLGMVIADQRRAVGLTQADLAERAGLSRDYIAKIENGRTSSVMTHAFRLLRRLGATITITFDDV